MDLSRVLVTPDAGAACRSAPPRHAAGCRRARGPAGERRAQVAVEPPHVLLCQGLADRWPQLLTSVRLLSAPVRDMAGRRLPAHRDPDEARESLHLLHTLTWGARSIRPVCPVDSRAWRLDAPATLDEQLLRKGMPARNASRRAGPRR